jgi:2-hydroxycyclohexanecarboxyl-CoA dehydrogenase
VIGDVNLEGAAEVAAEIGAAPSLLDVTQPQSSRDLVAQHGPFAILVNNAGTDEFGFFAQTEPALWDRLIAINLTGVFACTHAVLPGMQERRRGRIVNVSSEAGRVGSSGSAVYSAAKSGVLGFTKALAIENGRYGITINAVAPGPIETPLLMSAPEALGDIGQRIVDTMISSTNLRRLGHPDEVAAAIAFLASDDASYVTGQSLGVSGGLARI